MSIDKTLEGREFLSDELTRIIGSGNLGFIIQCGGKAKRLSRDIKAFTHLPESIDETESPEYQKFVCSLSKGVRSVARTPLGMILRDIPGVCPVYLHTYGEWKDIFSDELAAVNYWKHRGRPIPQREDRAYGIIDGEVKAISRLDGTSIFVSKGPAAIWEHFGDINYPEYLAFIDGCLLGIYFQDIVSALDILVEDESIDIVAFAQKLDQEQREADLSSEKKRFARIGQQAQRVYDNEDNYVFSDSQKPREIPEDVVMSEDWLGLLGTYVARAEKFLRITRELEGTLLSTESSNLVHNNVLAYHLKMPMTLSGYAGRKEGLKFAVYEPEWFIPAIKSEEDLKRIPQWVSQGKLNYRKLL